MSFKAEIEIDGYDGEFCGECKLWESESERGPIDCIVFKQRLFLGHGFKIKRIPQCLEAEKQYKEKENERITI